MFGNDKVCHWYLNKNVLCSVFLIPIFRSLFPCTYEICPVAIATTAVKLTNKNYKDLDTIGNNEFYCRQSLLENSAEKAELGAAGWQLSRLNMVTGCSYLFLFPGVRSQPFSFNQMLCVTNQLV